MKDPRSGGLEHTGFEDARLARVMADAIRG
jgi:hypothetical protein